MATVVPDPTRVLNALPDACLVLDADLVMVCANPAYLQLTGKTTDDLVGHRVPQVFAVNPADPTAATRLEQACQRVLRSGQPHPMGVVRYDLPTGEAGGFERRFWSVNLVPLLAAESTAFHPVVDFVLIRTREVTAVHTDLLRALELLGADTGADADRDEALLDLESSTVRTSDLAASLTAEVAQMREAMASRSVIEQAKGVLMRDRACTADDAFGVLRYLSQNSNRKLHTVADAVIATTHDQSAPVSSTAPTDPASTDPALTAPATIDPATTDQAAGGGGRRH